MRSILPLLAALLLAAPIARGGERPPWMTEVELSQTFGGKTIDGHYPNGQTFTETYNKGGNIDYRDERWSAHGRWSVINGSFCTLYDDDPTGGCFRVMQSGDNCYEFYFVARSEEEAKTPRSPDWSARAWISSRTSTCTEGANA